MQQLLLDITIQQEEPTLARFVPGKNHELLRVLSDFQKRKGNNHFLYIWGDEASGKTHLLKALNDQKAKYITPKDDLNAFSFDEAFDLYLVDDCENLEEDQQIALFNLFNAVKENNRHLIVASRLSSLALPTRNDVKSRMSWGLSYKIQALTDEEKIAVLKTIAKEEGFLLADNVLMYLMTHYPRDMGSLVAIVKALDQYSLVRKRPMTIPLLKEILPKD